MCSMRELVILAALVLALHAASLPTDTDVIYKCQEDQDNIATLAAERFINDHHRHGYKFKFVSLDSRSADEKWMFLGQSFFADFAIMETNCTNKEEEACKALCGDQAWYGFCKSSKVGNEEPEVECEIFEAQNITHPMKHPAQSRKDCKFHGRSGHAGHDIKVKTPDHRGHPEHAGHDHKDKKHDHRGHTEHPHLCPKGPSGVPESAPEGRHEFPCHGFVKIPPSIYPISPFPPPRLCRSPPDLLIPGPPPPSTQ